MKTFTKILTEAFTMLASLEDEIALQTWHRVVDRETAHLPSRSGAELGEQMSSLMRSADVRVAMEEALEALPNLDPETARNVSYWHSRWWRVAALPVALVSDLSKRCAQGNAVWRTAAQTGNFRATLPVLRDIVSLTQQKADHWRGAGSRYDALLKVYSPAQSVEALLQHYAWLDEFCEKGDNVCPAQPEATRPKLTLSVARELALQCGLDLSRTRLDRGQHSMTLTTGANDIRILLRAGSAEASLRQLYHEFGHARLEMLLKKAPRWSWRAQAPSQAFHEGVAKFFELAGPRISGVSASQIGAQKMASTTHRSAIRLETSGTWYSWHIWLRFKLERMLIEGKLDPADLSDAWDFEMRKRFDHDYMSQKAGCLQDVQWFMGLFGYFPLYWEASNRAETLLSKLQVELDGEFAEKFPNSIFDHLLFNEAEHEWDQLTWVPD